MTSCCFPLHCGNRKKSKLQKAVYPIDPTNQRTYIERCHGVQGDQIQQPEQLLPLVNAPADTSRRCNITASKQQIDNGCAPADVHATKCLPDICKNNQGVQEAQSRDELKHHVLFKVEEKEQISNNDPGPSSSNGNPQKPQQAIMQAGEASIYFKQEQTNIKGNENPEKTNTHSTGIQTKPDVSSASIHAKLCDNQNGFAGSTEPDDKVCTTNHLKGIRIEDGHFQVDLLIVESKDRGFKEPNVQQRPHSEQEPAAHVQQKQNTFETYNNGMVNDIHEELGSIQLSSFQLDENLVTFTAEVVFLEGPVKEQ